MADWIVGGRSRGRVVEIGIVVIALIAEVVEGR